MTPTYRYDAFVSYSHVDASWVMNELLPRLERAGLRVYEYSRDALIGVPSVVGMEQAVEQSRHVLAVLTPSWVNSDWSGFEALLTQTGDPTGRLQRLMPLMLQQCNLPPRIAMLTWADFTNSEEWDWQFERLIAQIRGEEGTLPPPPRAAYFTVPFLRNPGFVGREADLVYLHDVLQQHPQAGIRPAGLTGLGGIGKTQLAVEYAYSHRADYPDGIFWINAAEPLLKGFADLGRLVLPAIADRPSEEQAREAGRYLAAHADSLVILDNLVGPEVLKQPVLPDLLPSALPCRVLFTTRRRDLGAFPSVEVTVLPADAAMQLLLRAEHRQPILAPAHPEHRTALEVCAVLGHLPLALEIAGAHLAKGKDRPLAAYLKELLNRGALSVVDDKRGGVKATDLAMRHDAAVEATLASQWAQLASEDARLLLRVAGQLGEAAVIPVARLGLLAAISEKEDGFFAAPLALALQELYDWSLVEQLEAAKVRLHPLVQEFARKQTPESERAAFRAQCAENLRAAYRDVETLADQYTRRGVDALEGDIATGLGLAGSQAGPEELRSLLRLIQLETHTLRATPPALQPSKTEFLQQVQKRAVQLHRVELAGQACALLARETAPHLTLQWWAGRDDPALLRVLKGHEDLVNAVAVTPDARCAVSASDDRTLRVWDLRSGQCERVLAGHNYGVNAVAVTPNGRRAVSASWDNTLRVWDLRSGQCERVLTGHEDMVNAVAVTPDGERAISASEDLTLRVWDLRSGQCERVLAGHEDWVNSVAVTPDARCVVSASSDRTLRVWDLRSGQCERVLAGLGGGANGVAVTPDGGRAISASSDRMLRVWELRSGQFERVLSGHEGEVLAVAVTSDGGRAVSGSVDGSLRVWDLRTGECERVLAGHDGWVNGVAVTPDGGRAISASNDRMLRVWDLQSGLSERAVEGHEGLVNAAAVTADGGHAVSASWDHTLRVWDLGSGQCEHALVGHHGAVNAVAVTPDGGRAVSASWDTTLRVWDLGSGQCERVLARYEQGAMVVAVTPDGTHAVSASANPIAICDLGSGQCERVLAGHEGVTAVAVTPDGGRAISASWDRTLRVWDLSLGQCTRVLEGHKSPVFAVAVTPDGRCAVSASFDSTLRVWDLRSGECERVLTGHEGRVEAVAVTSDGQCTVSASNDRTLRVWDLCTGACLAVIQLDAALWCVAVTRSAETTETDGTAFRIVAGDRVGSVYCLRYEEPAAPA